MRTHNFSLKHTLECGQIFRCYQADGFYYVVTADKVLKLKQEGNELSWSSNSEEVNDGFVKKFFRLDEDYDTIIKEISRDKHVSDIVKRYSGLRLIRQEPFECLISYICSAASNIPKIRKNLDCLATQLGKRISYDNREFYSFPARLEDINKISECGVGFRKRYIYEASKAVRQDRNYFNELRKLDYEEAKIELKKLPGVGDKVADCVLLFSLDFLEAFPVDTWIRRAMTERYFNNKRTSDDKIRAFAKDRFGKYAGYAQQFLYHDKRKKK